MRNKLLDEIEPLLDMDKITSAMVKNLYQFLVQNKVEETLNSYADEFLGNNDISKELERILAYFVYRHCSESCDFNEFLTSLSFSIF